MVDNNPPVEQNLEWAINKLASESSNAGVACVPNEDVASPKEEAPKLGFDDPENWYD